MNSLNIKNKLNKNICHQGIGGKEILIEMEVSLRTLTWVRGLMIKEEDE